MDDFELRNGLWQRRRAKRERRAQDGRALRSEFELDRPRGFARLRALAASVGDLERERIRSHTVADHAAAAPAHRDLDAASGNGHANLYTAAVPRGPGGMDK
jgi:hypothetical protein